MSRGASVEMAVRSAHQAAAILVLRERERIFGLSRFRPGLNLLKPCHPTIG
ncbi:hypothetical protein [Rhizobium rhizogenes]|uniref:hypothetical protein n=1 Tax=Rhizobium rhizogenes TaxID=359 RepID=UPI001E4CCCD1|nr:hypothetical protein [Rhizobium rhizogenes]WEO69766.1 hypothetical protein G6L54_020035 [Rhizobium rhizogenes]